MKTMKMLYDDTVELAELSMCYSGKAHKMKDSNAELSKAYKTAAKNVLDLANQLHSASSKLAADKKAEGETVDPMLMEFWEEMESEKLHKLAEAKAYMDIS